MTDFFTSFICQSHVHCPTCRWKSEEGHRWRKSLIGLYDIPEIDFECPEERPWKNELKKMQNLAGIPDNAEKICGKCHEYRGCPNVFNCCGGQTIINIIVPCSQEYWKILEEQELLN